MAPNLRTWSWWLKSADMRCIPGSVTGCMLEMLDSLTNQCLFVTQQQQATCRVATRQFASLLWPCAYQRRYRVVRVQHETGVMSSCNIITNWSRSAYCLLLLLPAVATAFLQSVNKKNQSTTFLQEDIVSICHNLGW